MIQDLEEDRIDFVQSSLWDFANALSTVCMLEDEVSEVESLERFLEELQNFNYTQQLISAPDVCDVHLQSSPIISNSKICARLSSDATRRRMWWGLFSRPARVKSCTVGLCRQAGFTLRTGEKCWLIYSIHILEQLFQSIAAPVYIDYAKGAHEDLQFIPRKCTIANFTRVSYRDGQHPPQLGTPSVVSDLTQAIEAGPIKGASLHCNRNTLMAWSLLPMHQPNCVISAAWSYLTNISADHLQDYLALADNRNISLTDDISHRPPQHAWCHLRIPLELQKSSRTLRRLR